jgi:hypothetical protein
MVVLVDLRWVEVVGGDVLWWRLPRWLGDARGREIL